MKIVRDGSAIVFLLPRECLILEVEAHFDLAGAVCWDDPELEEVAMDAGAVEVMDTAYLQLILAMRRSALDRGKTFCVRRQSRELTELANLYGLQL